MTNPSGVLVGVVIRVSWHWESPVGMPLVHPNGSARPRVPVWVKCATSAECINLPIVAHADKGPVRVGHTMGQQ